MLIIYGSLISHTIARRIKKRMSFKKTPGRVGCYASSGTPAMGSRAEMQTLLHIKGVFFVMMIPLVCGSGKRLMVFICL